MNDVGLILFYSMFIERKMCLVMGAGVKIEDKGRGLKTGEGKGFMEVKGPGAEGKS